MRCVRCNNENAFPRRLQNRLTLCSTCRLLFQYRTINLTNAQRIYHIPRELVDGLGRQGTIYRSPQMIRGKIMVLFYEREVRELAIKHQLYSPWLEAENEKRVAEYGDGRTLPE